eukprot:jgi/Tetstr1/447348/TSEL_034785.t1
MEFPRPFTFLCPPRPAAAASREPSPPLPDMAFAEMLVNRVSELETRLDVLRRERDLEAHRPGRLARVVDGTVFVLDPGFHHILFDSAGALQTPFLVVSLDHMQFHREEPPPFDAAKFERVLPHWKPVIDAVAALGSEYMSSPANVPKAVADALYDRGGTPFDGYSQLEAAYTLASHPEMEIYDDDILVLRRGPGLEGLSQLIDALQRVLSDVCGRRVSHLYAEIFSAGRFPQSVRRITSNAQNTRVTPAVQKEVSEWSQQKAIAVLQDDARNETPYHLSPAQVDEIVKFHRLEKVVHPKPEKSCQETCLYRPIA